MGNMSLEGGQSKKKNHGWATKKTLSKARQFYSSRMGGGGEGGGRVGAVLDGSGVNGLMITTIIMLSGSLITCFAFVSMSAPCTRILLSFICESVTKNKIE